MGLKRIRKLDKRLLMGIYHYCSLGYSNKGIAELIDVNVNTLSRWRKNDSRLADKMDELRNEAMKDTLNYALMESAKGYKHSKVTKTWNETNDKGEIVTIKKETSIVPPNVKAIQVLARKYDKKVSDLPEIESTNINISLDGVGSMSQRELQEYNDANNPLDADVIETQGVTMSDMIDD